MDISSGTTIRLTAALPKPIGEYVNVVIYVYTNPKAPIKFSYNAKDGYGSIDSNGRIILLGAQTARLEGALLYAIYLNDDDSTPDEDMGSKTVSTGINLVATPIKSESC